ncbi:MAG: class F sortase [Chloroflexia bacterium]|nr:class F sortase [Chloroflexia bacterium]
MPTTNTPRRLDGEGDRSRRRSRRWAIGILAAAAVGAGRLIPALAQDEEGTPEAQESSIQPSTVGELPTTGALRPGPVGMEPPAPASARAARPVSLQIEVVGVDAEVETLNIVDGVMQNPTGPWVVSWYEETSGLGVRGNVVMAGHIDYWNVGPAVFYELANLEGGTEVIVSGEDDRAYTYAVETVETYELAELTSGAIQELVGRTPESFLTLITCGGEFDYASGEYLSRTVARARLVEE